MSIRPNNFISGGFCGRSPRSDATRGCISHERARVAMPFCMPSNDTLSQLLSIFKIGILLFVVITGWVVLSGKTHISNPHANFTNAFTGSSGSGGDVSTLCGWCTFGGQQRGTVCDSDLQGPLRI